VSQESFCSSSSHGFGTPRCVRSSSARGHARRLCVSLIQLADRYGRPLGEHVEVDARSISRRSPSGLECRGRLSSGVFGRLRSLGWLTVDARSSRFLILQRFAAVPVTLSPRKSSGPSRPHNVQRRDQAARRPNTPACCLLPCPGAPSGVSSPWSRLGPAHQSEPHPPRRTSSSP